MFTHKWKLRLEVESEDADSDPNTLVIETSGTHNSEHPRPVNECIAIDMSFVCEMLCASGKIVSPSGIVATRRAFCGQ